MRDISQKLLATFQIEHQEHVDQIRSLLAAGPPVRADLEEAFRRAHSLKGAARAVDLHSVEGLAHRLETLFSRVRQGTLPFDKEVAAVVRQVLDSSEDCMTALRTSRPSPGFESTLQAIDRLLGAEPEPAKSAVETPPAPAPALPQPSFQQLETVRITAKNFDGLLRSASDLLTESQSQNNITLHLDELAHRIAAMEKATVSLRRTAAAPLRRLRRQPELSPISSFLDSMDQQVRSLSRESNAVRRLQRRGTRNMREMGKQLQRDVWQARMAPAESLLEGCGKMIRDLAREESKEIEFRATCTAVSADRRVLEGLKDPITQVMRNSVSHGIETPQERIAKGKPPAGTVALRVRAEGQRLVVDIEDDGRGVDAQRVAEVTVAQGILSEQDAARCSPEELARVLFRPGFSTARSVSRLSGRGMGLSIVHEAVRRLRGDVEIRPAETGGTCIHLSVPLSIATHRLLLVTCGTQAYAIPIHLIERIHRIKLDGVETLEGKPVIVVGGEPVRLYSLQQLVSSGQPSESPRTGFLRVALLRSQGRRAAIAVDTLLWETDAVIHDLGAAAPPDGRVSGCVLLENGAMAFVLNPLELLETSAAPEAGQFQKPSEPVKEKTRPTILVVDDSMTTRTLEKSILEAHGYSVRVAVDGLEALAKLRVERADLVITDVQMPRMDGFELLKAMKQDRYLNQVPVIVVTSLESREDQAQGLSLGADAYIVKQRFDQAELLAAVRQIL